MDFKDIKIDFNKKNEAQYIEQKNLLSSLRKKISEVCTHKNDIERIMRDKVDDYILCEELPLSIQIGDRIIYVGAFTIDNQHIFFREYPKIMANIGAQIVNFEMLCDGMEMYKYLIMHKRLYKGLCKVIKKTVLNQQEYWQNERAENGLRLKLKKVSYRYFRKHITVEKLIQICFIIYLYNFDAEKKNLQILAQRMCRKELMETYMYSWLQDLVGLTGKFQLARLINVDYWHDETLKQEKELKING